MGLIDAQNQPITTGSSRVEFFKVQQGGTAEKRSDASAVFRTVGGPSRGIWVANTTFDEVGAWGAQVTLQRPGDATPKVARMSFEVQPKFSAPGYGDAAPRSQTPTAADVGGDVGRICSNAPPCELHQMSVAGALERGDKPLVVVFATPALCTSQLCAPELDAIVELHGRYADRANFVHVEIYEYPFDGQREASAVSEWNLPSEPWTFVIDRGGVVRDRFEGAAPPEELEPALQAVLA
jgi:peroxiredoxin